MDINNNEREYNVYASLPFLNIHGHGHLRLGPILLWSADRCDQFLDPSLCGPCRSFLNTIRCHKTVDSEEKLLTDHPLEEITCVSIDERVADEDKDALFTDGLYLLYFAAFYQKLYEVEMAPELSALGQFIMLSKEKLLKGEQNPVQCELRKKSIVINNIDLQMLNTLGNLLDRLYLEESSADEKATLKRILRSIRLFLNGLSGHTGSVFTDQPLVSDPQFNQPENIICVHLAFDSLLELKEEHSPSKLKQHLRSILNLRFGQPVEAMWKWVDQFFKLKNWALYAENHPKTQFEGNPVLPLSVIGYAIKLYIYVLISVFHRHKLINDCPLDKMKMPIFESIPRANVIAYLWDPEVLLTQLLKRMGRVQEEEHDPWFKIELEFWMKIYLQMHQIMQKRGMDNPAQLKPFCMKLGELKGQVTEDDGTLTDLLEKVCKNLSYTQESS